VKLRYDICTLFTTPGTEHEWVYVLQITSGKLIEIVTAMTLYAAILTALRALGA
jgi:hypothetical protein